MTKIRSFIKTALTALIILSANHYTFAQDSTKATVAKPVVKPAAKINPAQPGAATTTAPVKHYKPKTYQAKPGTSQPSVTTAAAPPAVQPTSPAAAPTETPESTDKTLRGQYQYVLSKTYRYQQPMIAALWKNVTDSLNVAKNAKKDAEAKLAGQTQSITALQNDVKTKEQVAADATTNRDEIALLGIPMSKTAYNLVMWGLVVVMGVVLAIVFMRTSGATREAKYRSNLYDELNDEFTAFKAKAKDKEMKLARELQTERNKVDELMGRG